MLLYFFIDFFNAILNGNFQCYNFIEIFKASSLSFLQRERLTSLDHLLRFCKCKLLCMFINIKCRFERKGGRIIRAKRVNFRLSWVRAGWQYFMRDRHGASNFGVYSCMIVMPGITPDQLMFLFWLNIPFRSEP